MQFTRAFNGTSLYGRVPASLVYGTPSGPISGKSTSRWIAYVSFPCTYFHLQGVLFRIAERSLLKRFADDLPGNLSLFAGLFLEIYTHAELSGGELSNGKDFVVARKTKNFYFLARRSLRFETFERKKKRKRKIETEMNFSPRRSFRFEPLETSSKHDDSKCSRNLGTRDRDHCKNFTERT